VEKQLIFDFYNTLYDPVRDQLYDGIIELLTNLSEEWDLVLITTGSLDRQIQITRLILPDLFSEIIIVDQKTQAAFQSQLNGYGITLIIGDRLEEEIAIAQKLGMPFILVNSTKESPAQTIKSQLEKYNV